MNKRTGLRFALLAAVLLAVPGGLPAQSEPDHHAQVEANASMAHHNHFNNPHMKWTAERAQSPDDQKRAEEVVAALRPALEKYRDYRVALDDGYKIFAPNVAQPEYHFTNYWNGFLNVFSFDPARPTSLLYRKTADGYELVGAMYTASRLSDEDDLNDRIPLSVGRWHQHVNICLPPRGTERTADWTRFGPRGAIVTKAECNEAGGRWRAHLFGWMIHVYPFGSESARIWTHH